MPTPLLLQADARHIPLQANAVHCVVTSPPYWGLRDYGLTSWSGGDSDCDHKPGSVRRIGRTTMLGGTATAGHQAEPYLDDICPKCGAERGETPLGLEPTPDCLGWATGAPCGQCYVCRMVAVFREVRRVLRPDGTLWLNLGDSYANDTKWGGTTGGKHVVALHGQPIGRMKRKTGLKPKDLIGIPWRIAFALQADGWYLRSDIVWQKLAPMPESVTDRPTRAHEFIFLLSPSSRYYYDADALREPHTALGRPPGNKSRIYLDRDPQHHTGEKRKPGQENSFHPNGRNIRDVWTLGPSPYPGAHFATFPLELPRRAILAGTSARGTCPACGAPWQRIVERTGHTSRREPAHQPGNTPTKTDSTGWQPATRPTDDWRPTCTCNAGDPIPATVLDPFAGSGTTLLAARALGRQAIGIDLSANYLTQARQRLDLDRLAAWQSASFSPPAQSDTSSLPLFAFP